MSEMVERVARAIWDAQPHVSGAEFETFRTDYWKAAQAAISAVVQTGFAFSDDTTPSAFLQWKGTDVCMDFYCKCGAHCHFDGAFAYCVKCPHCKTVYEMPHTVFPREACAATYPHHVETAKLLERDEDLDDRTPAP